MDMNLSLFPREILHIIVLFLPTVEISRTACLVCRTLYHATDSTNECLWKALCQRESGSFRRYLHQLADMYDQFVMGVLPDSTNNSVEIKSTRKKIFLLRIVQKVHAVLDANYIGHEHGATKLSTNKLSTKWKCIYVSSYLAQSFRSQKWTGLRDTILEYKSAKTSCNVSRLHELQISGYVVLLHVIILGSGSVGKTSIVMRLSNQVYCPMSTIAMAFTAQNLLIDEIPTKVQIWNTAGHRRFYQATSTHTYFRGASGIILVYDITSRRSFEELSTRWIPQIREEMSHWSDEFPVILVGNKSDLALASREVAQEEAKALMDKHSDIIFDFIETSALTGTNVEEALSKVAHNAMRECSKPFPKCAQDLWGCIMMDENANKYNNNNNSNKQDNGAWRWLTSCAIM